MTKITNEVLAERLDNVTDIVTKIDGRFQAYPTSKELDLQLTPIREDIKDLKSDRTHLVVDNTNKTDWKGVGVIVGATIAAILAAIQQVMK